ncbi:hypothetical protein T492DRAFT_853721 [Pavlovales sp. CCMP2436]|nr:hypothetical protein T492DRAFT_853721 [Pavlovales sp. CCMP2436]
MPARPKNDAAVDTTEETIMTSENVTVQDNTVTVANPLVLVGNEHDDDQLANIPVSIAAVVASSPAQLPPGPRVVGGFNGLALPLTGLAATTSRRQAARPRVGGASTFATGGLPAFSSLQVPTGLPSAPAFQAPTGPLFDDSSAILFSNPPTTLPPGFADYCRANNLTVGLPPAAGGPPPMAGGPPLGGTPSRGYPPLLTALPPTLPMPDFSIIHASLQALLAAQFNPAATVTMKMDPATLAALASHQGTDKYNAPRTEAYASAVEVLNSAAVAIITDSAGLQRFHCTYEYAATLSPLQVQTFIMVALGMLQDSYAELCEHLPSAWRTNFKKYKKHIYLRAELLDYDRELRSVLMKIRLTVGQANAADFGIFETSHPEREPPLDQKFKAAKSCFKFQMTGLACGKESCARINGMSSTDSADRDAAYVAAHAAVCSYCSSAGYVGSCHATPDWLAANLALPSFTYP